MTLRLDALPTSALTSCASTGWSANEEVFFCDPRAAVVARGKRSIALDRVDPNVDALGLFVVEENMAGFTGEEARERSVTGPATPAS